MGREIRRVPVDWQHPRQDCRHSPWNGGCEEAKRNGGKCYQPLYNEDAETAWTEWMAELEEFKKEELARIVQEYPDEGYSLDAPYSTYCKWNGTPPDPEYYRPKWPQGTELGYAVYETVSEGTPVTPAFATKEELVDYLATKGTYWDDGKAWPREAAERFVKAEWAPSMMMMVNEGGAQIIEPNNPEMYKDATTTA